MASNAAQQLQDNQSYRHHLIWLDENMNKFYNKQSLKQLREIDSEIKSFVCQEECIDYVRQQDDRNSTSYIIFIVSGSLSKNTIPRIEDYTCIHTIFIFCTNIDRYADIQSPKLRAILNDPNELMDSIQMCIARDNTVTSFSCFSDQHSSRGESISSKEQYPIRNLKEDQARFIWHYHMHDFMVTMEDNDDENARENLFDRCREHYRDKPLMLLKIEEFQQECQRDNDENALHWYTKNSFVYDCLNTVLRQENISQVYSYRYIIKLLCRQLTEQHKKFIKKYKKKEKTSLRLYRGVHLKPDEIDFLTRNTNNLIAFNGFVSTTKKQDIAEQFIQHRWKEGCKPVLIIIKIDMTTEYSVAFADISKFSKYPEEAEVLLSIGSVFRVESVDFDEEDELHIVRLSLCQHNQLTVINYIEQTYAKNVDTADKSVLFGKLLFDMGECETAATYFKDALERLTDNNNQLRANYLNNLGVCYNEMGEKDEALKYYKGALKLYEQANNKRGIGACQHNIASIYHAKGDHNKALRWALEAFDFRQTDKIEMASTLDLLGCIRLALLDVEAANNNFREALQLRLKSLSKINPNHPDIGISYHNLGEANSQTFNFSDAEVNYSRAAEIYRHNYPPLHPLVRGINKCLEKVQQQLR